MEAANNLVKEFCRKIGMGELGLDEENQRSLSFDDKTIVSFIGEPDDHLVGICFVGELAKDFDARVFLEQNFIADSHGGGRYALEPQTNRVSLVMRWDATRIDVDAFSNSLEEFVNSAMRAQEFLNQGGASAEAVKSLSLDSKGVEATPASNDTLAAYQQNMI